MDVELLGCRMMLNLETSKNLAGPPAEPRHGVLPEFSPALLCRVELLQLCVDAR